eukprot:10503239-Ditylum_brightwellii.AAC.1
MHRTRLTCCSDRIEYDSDVVTPMADIITAKILFNCVLSTPGAKYLEIDIKDFYLNTVLNTLEYTHLQIALIAPEIIDQYKLLYLVPNRFVYMKMSKAMYYLSQAGRIVHYLLVKNLAPHGYYPCARMPSIWCHIYKPTTSILCVDKFGVKYLNQKDAGHLVNSIKDKYCATVDWKGTKCCCIMLDWNHPEWWLDISVPGYVGKG